MRHWIYLVLSTVLWRNLVQWKILLQFSFWKRSLLVAMAYPFHESTSVDLKSKNHLDLGIPDVKGKAIQTEYKGEECYVPAYLLDKKGQAIQVEDEDLDVQTSVHAVQDETFKGDDKGVEQGMRMCATAVNGQAIQTEYKGEERYVPTYLHPEKGQPIQVQDKDEEPDMQTSVHAVPNEIFKVEDQKQDMQTNVHAVPNEIFKVEDQQQDVQTNVHAVSNEFFKVEDQKQDMQTSGHTGQNEIFKVEDQKQDMQTNVHVVPNEFFKVEDQKQDLQTSGHTGQNEIFKVKIEGQDVQTSVHNVQYESFKVDAEEQDVKKVKTSVHAAQNKTFKVDDEEKYVQTSIQSVQDKTFKVENEEPYVQAYPDALNGQAVKVENKVKEQDMQNCVHTVNSQVIEVVDKGAEKDVQACLHAVTGPSNFLLVRYVAFYKGYFMWIVVLTFALLPAVVNSAFVEVPKNAVLMQWESSQMIVMACKSDLGWNLKWFMNKNQASEKEIFNGLYLRSNAESYYVSIANETVKLYFNLTTKPEAAQTYTCLEPGTLAEASADLIWIGERLRYNNSTKDSVNLMCSIKYKGKWSPLMEWKEHTSHGEKVLSNGVISTVDYDQRLTSTLVVPRQNGSRSYSCTAKFDINGKPPKTNANIPDDILVGMFIISQDAVENGTYTTPENGTSPTLAGANPWMIVTGVALVIAGGIVIGLCVRKYLQWKKKQSVKDKPDAVVVEPLNP